MPIKIDLFVIGTRITRISDGRRATLCHHRHSIFSIFRFEFLMQNNVTYICCFGCRNFVSNIPSNARKRARLLRLLPRAMLVRDIKLEGGRLMSRDGPISSALHVSFQICELYTYLLPCSLRLFKLVISVYAD